MIKNNMKHHVLAGWPEIQDFMVHERWNECVFCIETENHPVGDGTYAVPFDLYEEVCQIPGTEQTLEDAADFISMAAFELGEEVNEDRLDDKLLYIAGNL